MNDQETIGRFAEKMKALGDPHRLKILYLLMTRGEMCVCECLPAMGLTQSNLSFHLKTLKQARFVRARKSGKWMYYSLNREALERFLEAIGEVFDLSRWPAKTHSKVCDAAACDT
jgi:ArsR family transcriptional regulator, arsenate/arsenite/antimonite-responsive transcriptional repressor